MKKTIEIAAGISILGLFILACWGSYKYGMRNYDSLVDQIEQMKPDTVHHWDTIQPINRINWIDSVNIIRRYPEIYDTISGDTLNFYNDSIETDEVQIFIKDKIDGIILDRQIGYRLKVPQIVQTTTITNPPLIIKKNPSSTGLYYGGGLGFGREGIAGTFGLNYVTKGNMIFGAEYLRTESKGYLLLNVKLKLR